MSNYLVDILLATYNGARYIREQIDSIINQTYQNIRLLIHDDCSTDGTSEILREYQKRYPERISFIDDGIATGGAVKNFEHLLKYSSAEYIMFSDQDDVWFPNKVELTLGEMFTLENRFGKDKPLMVYTDAVVTNEKLEILCKSFFEYTGISPTNISVGRVLGTSLGLGCSMMINSATRSMSLPFSERALMHDAWISLVVYTFGHFSFLKKPTLYYRQHSSNTFGTRKWKFSKALMRFIPSEEEINEFREGYLKRRNQAEDFLKVFGDKIPLKVRKGIEAYITLADQGFMSRAFNIISYGIGIGNPIRDWVRIFSRWLWL
ncbi:MAG: glycosyltransferase family 2 protein [Brevinematia bacterium]